MSLRVPWSLALAVACVGCAAHRPPSGEAGAMRVRVRADTTASGSRSPARPVPAPVDVPSSYEAAVAAGTRAPDGAPGPAYWQQSADYSLDVRLDTEKRRLSGTTRVRYHNASPDTLHQLYLQLIQNVHAPGAVRNAPLAVTRGVELSRVAVGGQEIETGRDTGPRYVVGGTVLGILPPSPVPPGGSVELALDYAFDIPQRGAEGRMGWSRDDLFFLGYFYPQMAVYDDVAGWDLDPFRGRAEFHADFGHYDVTIDAPAGWLVDGTGTLQNPDETLTGPALRRLRAGAASDSVVHVLTAADSGAGHMTRAGRDGRLTWHFVADSVHDVAYSVTRRSNWDVTRTPVGDRDGDGAVDYARIGAIWRDAAPLWRNAARYAAHAIRHHSAFTGLSYAWPHMTAVEGAGIIEGGMEYPMMTVIGDYNARGDSALYAVVAHELAHEWVPMMVATNERRYGWMDEGTTTFNENQAKKDSFPGHDWDVDDRDDYLEFAGSPDEGPMMRWSDFQYSRQAYTIASYAKPATVLATLRALLGEERFLATYRAFFDRWAFRHPYPWDLFHTFDDVSGRDLGWFWRAWYDETWILDQAVAGVERHDDGSAAVTIADVGSAPMPVRLTITRSDGSTSRREVPVDVWLSGADRTTVELGPGPAVTKVEIDADRAFPDIDRSNDTWTAP